MRGLPSSRNDRFPGPHSSGALDFPPPLKEAELVRCERRAQEQVYSLNTSVFEDVATTLLDLFRRPIPRRPRT